MHRVGCTNAQVLRTAMPMRRPPPGRALDFIQRKFVDIHEAVPGVSTPSFIRGPAASVPPAMKGAPEFSPR